ncbi:MAG: hypothetical protein ATN35_04125 [Epulopiscium sp. Nele67-Bin004]|nr:MAG: hypothetical protein ATN35_04125 [Epulopiscium sp. Nele67-Bin004]
MYHVQKQTIKPTDNRYARLDELCFLSKNLYNATLYHIRQQYFKDKIYLNYNYMDKFFNSTDNTDYRALPAKVSKFTLQLVNQSFKSFFELIKLKKAKKYEKPIRMPKYLPKNGRQVVHYTKQALSFKKEGYVRLSKEDIEIFVGELPVEFIKIVPRGRHIDICVGYKIDEKEYIDNNRYASIDLGVNNLATITSNVFSPFIINGKPLKSINEKYSNNIADKKSKLQDKKYSSKTINNMYGKRQRKINDYLHKSSRYIVNYLVSNQVNTLIIGYNKEWKQNINLSTKTNRIFASLPFNKFIEILTYKCKIAGIKLILQEESYTSKCSFLDNEDINKHKTYKGKRITRGLFKTGERIINADVNGSYNILKKGLIKLTAWNENIFSDCVRVNSTPKVYNF